MGIKRRLPNSDETRHVALSTAKTKKDNTPPGNIVITPNTTTRLDAAQPLFAQKMQARGKALLLQSISTSLKAAAQAKAKMYISHFIQTFNMGVDRGVFPTSHRAFYQLEISSKKVPPLNTEPLVTFWVQRLIDGDVERLAAGEAAIQMPSIAEVTTEYNIFKTANIEQSTAKDAYDKSQEAVSGMRPEVGKLILRIWDEVETAFDDEPIESKRRKAREWGVVYVSTQKATITGTVTDAATGNPLQGVDVALIESGDIVQTLVGGTYALSTSFTGAGTLVFSLEGYETQTIPVEVHEGGPLIQDAALVAM
ncbi:carboxypeptidase-like regulatory domain-containing protein [Bacteroidota bacterium]